MTGPGPFAAAITQAKEQLDRRRQSKRPRAPWCTAHDRNAPHTKPDRSHCCALDVDGCVIEWRDPR